MIRQASLFGDPFDRQGLADKVRALSRQNIFIGTSSWRYEGWLGKIYTAERYYTRGRFSKKKFHEQCIAEYAETFPVVGGDFSFYAIPEPTFWKKLFEDAPAHLKWSLKVVRSQNLIRPLTSLQVNACLWLGGPCWKVRRTTSVVLRAVRTDPEACRSTTLYR